MVAFFRDRAFTFISILLLATCLPACKKDKQKPIEIPQDIPVSITSLSVNSGSCNTVVEINGKMFNSDATKDSVYFNGKAAKIISATDTKIVVIVPLSAGAGKVSVSVNNGTPAMGPVFTYTSAMMVTTYAGLNGEGIYDSRKKKMSFHYLRDITIDMLGSIYAIEINIAQLDKIDGSGTASLFLRGDSFYEEGTNSPSFFSNPYKVTTDAKGNVYVVDDFYGSRIFKITPNRIIKMISTKYNPLLHNIGQVSGIVVDPEGTIFVATDHDIRKISTDGVLSVIAGGENGYNDGIGTSARFENLSGLTIDQSGNLYAIDMRRIRKITKEGVVTTFAGNETGGLKNGVGTQATFGFSTAIVADAKGNIYVADPDNFVIRKITPEREVTTFAGTGWPGTTDGLSQNASFSSLSGITVDAAGIVYVSEGFPGIIRKIGLQ
ncbi:IPT/TIG domain-containing protein [Mucilaginibacter sp.]|uniref:IPT/TIG domain-containing protein n=1 Tax=Mucilaginibacter sp. TaxID=1882438 RepID=UPI00262134E4|nr:IPT/TIG domain-containing protein [Mucilaginibacter sp.]MDB5129064.1 hypothetical protein [Mucilaginibacter sp.]